MKKWWVRALWVVALLAWVFVAVVGSEFLVGLLVSWLVPVDVATSTVGNSTFSLLAYLLAVFLIIVLPPKLFNSKIGKISRERLGLMGLPSWTDIGLAPIGYVVTIGLAAGLTAFFGLFPWFDAGEAQALGYSYYMVGWERAIAFIELVVIAPIIEELIFRGWLYGKLRVKIPKIVAILATSLVFALVHMQWNVGVTVFAMSIVTCSLREVTGNIYAGTLVHMINNGIAFYLVYVAGLV